MPSTRSTRSAAAANKAGPIVEPSLKSNAIRTTRTIMKLNSLKRNEDAAPKPKTPFRERARKAGAGDSNVPVTRVLECKTRQAQTLSKETEREKSRIDDDDSVQLFESSIITKHIKKLKSPNPKRQVTAKGPLRVRKAEEKTPTLERKAEKPHLAKTPFVETKMAKHVNSQTPEFKQIKATTNKDTFPGRLDWKFQHYGMPVTSTPKAAQATVTKTDVETCFGFDESEEDENYSALISPIAAPLKTPRAVNQAKIKPVKRDELQVLQVNNSNEQPKTSSVENVDRVQINSIEKPEKAADKKVKTRKAYTRQPKRKIAETTPRVQLKRQKNIAKAKFANQMYELEDFMNSQQAQEEVDASGMISDLGVGIFVKETKGDAGFNALLARYGKSDKEELEFHIDPGKITKTYNSKKRENAGLVHYLPLKSKRARKSTLRRSIGGQGEPVHEEEEDDEDDDDEVDPETKKWLEQKNKEFDDVLHVPLMVTKVKTKIGKQK